MQEINGSHQDIFYFNCCIVGYLMLRVRSIFSVFKKKLESLCAHPLSWSCSFPLSFLSFRTVATFASAWGGGGQFFCLVIQQDPPLLRVVLLFLLWVHSSGKDFTSSGSPSIFSGIHHQLNVAVTLGNIVIVMWSISCLSKVIESPEKSETLFRGAFRCCN